jgi:hypothetical protein
MDSNSAGLFAENLYGPLVEKHVRAYFDDYMEHERNDKGDSVDWTMVWKRPLLATTPGSFRTAYT